MAPDTDSPRSEPEEVRELHFGFSTRVSLTPRILFVNIFALVLLAGGFYYLDSYRSRLVDGRLAQASREVRLIAEAIAAAPVNRQDGVALKLAHDTGYRVRLYDNAGRLRADTQRLGLANVVLADPSKQDWGQVIARFLDAMIDIVVGAPRPALYRELPPTVVWPDVRTALAAQGSTSVWRAPDRTPVITAAAALAGGGAVMTTVNARDITQTVRVERYRFGLILLMAVLLSVLLSLFLARTIVRPMRQLARAAVRVRLGRAREVVVPRLPERRDEIGLLARALSDMSLALRARFDAIEAFAADVAHEMKNPLASLRSAVDTLASVEDPALRARLLAIVRDDVHRLDRLITDTADASRLDAQLSRARFEPVDLAALVAALIAGREARGLERGVQLRLDRTSAGPLLVFGDGERLERVIANLVANAESFSPDGGLVTIAAGRIDDRIALRVEDEGPGVPEEAREKVFTRFQSLRPDDEAFGRHSGLGLAIAKTIVEAHEGTIAAGAREDRMRGARFTVLLPALAP